jgi:hypothetical protein
MLSAILMIITLCAVPIAGCGGSTKTSVQNSVARSANRTVQFRQLNDAELIAATDSACHRIHTKLASYSISTVAQLGIVARGLSKYEDDVIAELDKLTPSSSLAGDWRQIVADLHILAHNTARLGEMARKHKLSGANALIGEVNDARQRVLTIARRDGFKGCTQIVL